MIRKVKREDLATVIDAAAACGLFAPEEIPVLRRQLERTLSGESERAGFWLSDFDAQGVAQGVAYCAEEQMTDRAWNLLFIGVRTGQQGRGLGTQLLATVEAQLREDGGRLLLVETANGDDFEQARGFYLKHGFREEGTVRNFYAAGMHKVVFCKPLE